MAGSERNFEPVAVTRDDLAGQLAQLCSANRIDLAGAVALPCPQPHRDRWRRWLAIAVGFAGVLIIIRPGVEGFEFASILVVVSVFFAAARDLATRALPAALPSLLVSAASAVLVTVFAFAVLFIQGNWITLETRHLKVLLPASVFLFFGYQFIVLAMRTGDVSYVVPYRYTSLLWSIFLGYLFFAEVPDTLTLIGSAIVVSMGLFTVYRELLSARRGRRQRSDLSS